MGSSATSVIVPQIPIAMHLREFLFKAVVVATSAGLIGFALKFTTYFEQWVYLPNWPNRFDVVFIVFGAMLVLLLGLRADVDNHGGG